MQSLHLEPEATQTLRPSWIGCAPVLASVTPLADAYEHRWVPKGPAAESASLRRQEIRRFWFSASPAKASLADNTGRPVADRGSQPYPAGL